MDGIVHLILNCGKEILCGLAIEGVVHSGGVNVRDFLVKAPFAGPNLLNLGNQVIEVVLIKITIVSTVLGSVKDGFLFFSVWFVGLQYILDN